MPNQWDANIKLLYPVDDGTFFTVDSVNVGDEFDVIANVEVGANIMQNVDGFDLRVAVRNLTKSTILDTQSVSENLTDQADPLNREIRVDFPGGWTEDDGDVLEAVGAFKVRAGINSDYSSQGTETFMVSTS